MYTRTSTPTQFFAPLFLLLFMELSTCKVKIHLPRCPASPKWSGHNMVIDLMSCFRKKIFSYEKDKNIKESHSRFLFTYKWKHPKMDISKDLNLINMGILLLQLCLFVPIKNRESMMIKRTALLVLWSYGDCNSLMKKILLEAMMPESCL